MGQGLIALESAEGCGNLNNLSFSRSDIPLFKDLPVKEDYVKEKMKDLKTQKQVSI